jgi:error-prone DNA polymerase
MDSIGIADRNTLAGVVRMHSACKGAGLKPLIGCRLDLVDTVERPSTSLGANGNGTRKTGPFLSSEVETRNISLLAYPKGRDGYGRLARLLSLGKMRAAKGECELTLDDVAAHRDGIAFIAWPATISTLSKPSSRGFVTPFHRFVMSRRHTSTAATTMRGSSGSTGIARANGCTILATNDVHYHAPDRRPLQDVMTCIREKVTIAKRASCSTPMPSGI